MNKTVFYEVSSNTKTTYSFLDDRSSYRLRDRLKKAFAEVSTFEDNWDSYGGKPPSKETIKFAELQAKKFPKNLQPYICPFADGTIGLYWRLKSTEKAFVLYINLDHEDKYIFEILGEKDTIIFDEDDYSTALQSYQNRLSTFYGVLKKALKADLSDLTSINYKPYEIESSDFLEDDLYHGLVLNMEELAC